MTEAAAGFPESAVTNVQVLIVGAGFSGLCMGIKLLEAGMKSFLIVEKGEDIGGTWWDNRYPDAPAIFLLICIRFPSLHQRNGPACIRVSGKSTTT